MSTIRVRKDTSYFVAANEPFNDSTLSWEARGVLAYLLSKPDDWTVLTKDLINRGPAGEYKTQRIINELKDAGYMKREKKRNEDGTFSWVTTVYERRGLNPDQPSPNYPGMDKPSMDKPSMDNQGILVSTDQQSTENTNGSGAVFSTYMDEIGTISPVISDQILDAIDEFGEEAIIRAIHIAVDNNVRKWSYVDGILKRWRASGVQDKAPDPSDDAKQAWSRAVKWVNGADVSTLEDRDLFAVRKVGESNLKMLDRYNERDLRVKFTHAWLEAGGQD